MASLSAAIGATGAVRRCFATAAPKRSSFQSQTSRPTNRLPIQNLRQSFRRSYADQKGTVSPETQQKIKRKGAGFFKWTWRLTLLSLVGGSIYTGYGIYVNRNPADQTDPDPSKKTLVVLGMCTLSSSRVTSKMSVR